MLNYYLTIVLAPLAAAAPDCKCRYFGQFYALGDRICIRGRVATCALVLNNSRLSHQDIAHAQAVLKKNDPRRLPAGTRQQILLSERDLNLAAN